MPKIEEDMLLVATHYYEIGRYQHAYDQLTSMALNIDREDQIDHHLLLADLLYKLDKSEDARELIDVLLSKFPDNDQCMAEWIRHAGKDPNRVEEAYNLAQALRKKDPADYWLPLVMAKMAFDYRLQPKTTIIALLEQALAIKRDEQTIATACKIFCHFLKPIEIKPYIDELVQLAPEAESTYLLLLEFLKKSNRYNEHCQISYEALKRFPDNQELAEDLETSIDYLYGGYFGRLFNFCTNIGQKIKIERSSNKRWFRALQSVSTYAGMTVALMAFIIGAILCGLAMLFFFHFFIFTCDERNIKKQRKKRTQKFEFQYADQVTDINDAASALVSSTHLKYRFILLNEKEIVLSKEVWCPAENLHFDLDRENLEEFESIAHHQIKRIEVSSKYLIIRTAQGSKYMMYFESLDTLTFILDQLKRYHYQLIKTKRSSRFLLSLMCFFMTKSGLALSFLAFLASWKIGIVVFFMVLTNISSFFIYRFIHPLEINIFQSKKSVPQGNFLKRFGLRRRSPKFE